MPETHENQKALELLKNIALGSEVALVEFYDTFHSSIYNFAIRRLNEHADAADVLNDVMLQVWKNAGSFKGRAKVMTWVFGITHHKVIDKLRKSSRHVMTELEETLPDDDSFSVTDSIMGAQRSDYIKQCMAQLSNAHRQVIHLAFFEELSYPEIAEIVDCPEGTVKTRMFHAKQILKRCLAKFVGNND